MARKVMSTIFTMVHLWLCHMMWRIDFRGFRNHMKDESGRIGFSRPLGSSLPRPAGFFSASSAVSNISSASTFPCNKHCLGRQIICDVDLEHHLVVVVLGGERPPSLGALLLEQVDGGDGAVGPEHVEGAEPRAPGAPGELGQVQRDRAQEVVLGERVRVPHLKKWCSDL